MLVLGEEGGPTISEILYKYKPEKMTYSYRITDVDVQVLPVTNYSSHLTVKRREGGGSIIEWRSAFYRGYPLNDPPEELNDEAAIKAVTAVYEQGFKPCRSGSGRRVEPHPAGPGGLAAGGASGIW